MLHDSQSGNPSGSPNSQTGAPSGSPDSQTRPYLACPSLVTYTNQPSTPSGSPDTCLLPLHAPLTVSLVPLQAPLTIRLVLNVLVRDGTALDTIEYGRVTSGRVLSWQESPMV